jgi:hypothetical protein
METIYGHLMPALPCRISWTNYIDPIVLSVFYAEHGIVVNVRGERFVDEGAGELNGETINAAATQPPGGLWVVMDDEIRRNHARYELPGEIMRPRNLRHVSFLRYVSLRRQAGGISGVIDSYRYARDRGALILEATTLELLADQLAEHGVNGRQVLDTIEEFNAHVYDGQALGLAFPKAKNAHRIGAGPFHAIKVAVGISMTYGGVAINERAEVLDEDGVPIAGLYAVPGTAGGIYRLHYGGALAACGVYGMIAGAQAAAVA